MDEKIKIYEKKMEGGNVYREEKIKNIQELEFVVFCIENIAEKLDLDAGRIYEALTEKSDILNEYIVPEYEILHTQSKEYIVDDIVEIIRERGVEV